ncbi:AI-2E family transporter [Streptomyces sp. Z26]|uniref:AI-2E family transporter n=1 Tax=Streptomyces TaxID=1883 RepID=UPI000EF155AD|nr:AI-2E family transporter [Streptomyces sp. Z26]RLL69181.1 AI-2E family transporter [Streptomyces sp. Z26]
MSATVERATADGVDLPAPPPERPATHGEPPAIRAGMPEWLPRAMVLGLALLGCFQLVGWAFDRLVGLLLNVLIAFFLALAMEPAVDWLAARGVRRGAGTGLVFLGVATAVAGFLAALGSVLADQVTLIADNLPAYVDHLVRQVNATFHTRLDAERVRAGVLHSDWLREYVQRNADSVWGLSATVLGGVFQLLTVALFAFYLTADGPRLRRALCSVLPPARQAEVLRAWEIAVAKTGGYLYSRGLMALVSALAHYVFLELLGVPYAPALAVWVGVVSQFVPTVGTYLAGALPVLLAFTVDPWSAVWVICFVVLYQQFENYVLQPRVTAMTVDIHPAVAFGSVIAGTALMGVVGALIAVPATATLQGFLGAYVKRYDVTDPRVHGRPRRSGRPEGRRARRWNSSPDSP